MRYESAYFLPPDDRPRKTIQLEARSVGAAASNPVLALEQAVLTIARERKLNFSEAVDIVRAEQPTVFSEGIAHYGKREPKVRLTSSERQRRDLLAEVQKRIASKKAASFADALSQIKSESSALYEAVANDYAAPAED